MRSVYLIRHGENELKYGDPELTEKGMKQANRITLAVDIIYTSPTRRTKETADIIAKNSNNVEVVTTSLLKERIDMLDMLGNTYEEYRQICFESANNRHFVLPNGESGYSTALRYEYVIATALNRTVNDVAIVGHQGAFGDLMKNKFSGEYLNSIYPTYSDVREAAFKNCSITKMNIDYNIFELEYLGSVKHLK